MMDTLKNGQMRLFSRKRDSWTYHVGRGGVLSDNRVRNGKAVGDLGVPFLPLIKAWDESGISASEVARRMGWNSKSFNGKLLRSRAEAGGRVTTPTALKMIKALHLLPRDFGL